MKLYGYSNNTNELPMELSEATISAAPEVLRELARFLEHCANEIELHGNDWEHEHFSSKKESVKNGSPAVIVFNPSAT